MKWVTEHIAAFGGNGADITIFGESAGGNSVMNHLAQPESFQYYTKAIIESGAYNTGAISLDDAERKYTKLLSEASCKSTGGLGCLKGKSGDDIQKAGSGGGWGPTVDGVGLTDTPTNLVRTLAGVEIIRPFFRSLTGAHPSLHTSKHLYHKTQNSAQIEKGAYNTKVPVVIGSNRDEEAFFTILLGIPANLTELEFDALAVGKDVKKLKSLYKPAPPHGSGEYIFPAGEYHYRLQINVVSPTGEYRYRLQAPNVVSPTSE
jgi:carboxylesterase type B